MNVMALSPKTTGNDKVTSRLEQPALQLRGDGGEKSHIYKSLTALVADAAEC